MFCSFIPLTFLAKLAARKASENVAFGGLQGACFQLEKSNNPNGWLDKMFQPYSLRLFFDMI